MKKNILRIICAVLVISMMIVCCGCGSSSQSSSTAASGTASDAAASDAASDASAAEAKSLSIAYQYGLGYAPLIICQQQGLIEEAYAELTGGTVTVEWNLMSSGSDINTGIASGDIDIGFMGISPAITGISKDVGYKIFTGVSCQEHGLMTNDPDINSLGDIIGSSKQIALVNIGSFQHIVLAKALADNGYDPHALDSNIVAMKNPDGMTAVESGSVACHVTTNPYIFKERDNESLHELTEVNAAWTVEKTHIVGVAATTLYTDDNDLYLAVCNAIAKAADLITDDPEGAAAITYEFNGNTVEEEAELLQRTNYTTATSGLFEVAQFMSEYSFVDAQFSSYSELVFDNVQGD